MKTIVVYESKYGFTEKYARWIAEELACELVERKAASLEKLRECDIIVYGGGLYAGGVSGVNLLTKHASMLSGKQVILFTCGLADPADYENVEHIRGEITKALPEALQGKVKLFHLRGGIDYARLSAVHRAMMAMLCQVLKRKKPDELRAEDKELLRTYGKAVDFTDRGTIQPIIAFVRELENRQPGTP